MKCIFKQKRSLRLCSVMVFLMGVFEAHADNAPNQKLNFWKELSQKLEKNRWSTVRLTFPAANQPLKMLWLVDEYPPVFERPEVIVKGAIEQAISLVETHDPQCLYDPKSFPDPKGPNRKVIFEIVEIGYGAQPSERHQVKEIKFKTPGDPSVFLLVEPKKLFSTHVVETKGEITVIISNR